MIIRNKNKTLFTIDTESFRDRVLNWVLAMQTGPTQFKMSQDSDATIFTSCFALFIFDLFGLLKTWSQKERDLWIDYISTFQDKETGYFIPENFSGELVSKPVHQLTTFCLSALGALEALPKYDFKFLDLWLEKKDAYNYLETKGCFDGRPGSGNTAMFFAIFLTHHYERYSEQRVFDLIENWFEWHNKTQNPATGFWGNSWRKKYFAGFQNAFHQFTIYNYWKKTVSYCPQIIDMVLALQDSDGFLAPNLGGSGCYDFDATDILIHCGYKKKYKMEEVKSALLHLFFAILESQNNDGGFCETRKLPTSVRGFFSFHSLAFLLTGPDLYSRYYKFRNFWKIATRKKRQISLNPDWTRKNIVSTQSDLWNTWFRCLTLAEISETIQTPLSSMKWNFLKTIGLGWFE